MLFLSEKEKKQWSEYARSIFGENISPGSFTGVVRENLQSAFDFYAGTFLAARGKNRLAVEWLRAGALNEEEGLFSSTFLLGFLERHNGELRMPALPFEDPKRFIHFAGVPDMKKAREKFIQVAGHTLPTFTKPVSFMDIGCGDGALTVRLSRGQESRSNPTARGDSPGSYWLTRRGWSELNDSRSRPVFKVKLSGKPVGTCR